MNERTVRLLSVAFFIALLLWGVYTLVAWLGVPYHSAILLGDEQLDALRKACADTDTICRGWRVSGLFLLHTARRLGPFWGYIILSGILYGVYVAVRFFKHKSMGLQCTLRPITLIALFALSVLLIFSGLAFGAGTVQGDRVMPLREIVEPNEQVYKGIGPEGIEQLKRNFRRLGEGGCLRNYRQFGVSPTFLIGPHCIYASFVAKVLSQLLFVLLFLLELLVVGRFVLRRVLRCAPPQHRGLEFIFSLGLGAGSWIALLWAVAVAGIFVSTAGWLLVLLMPAILYRHTLYWLRQLLRPICELRCRWYHPGVLLSWLLLSYLAFNFLTVVRPFPIGWDDLGSYINRPRLLVSYGQFIHSMASFQWEYLTSLGFLLFGYESVFGATASMMINWTAGLIAVLTVLTFGSVFLGSGRGVLAALLYYMLPLVGHFSFADMKIDNAVFAMGGLSMLAVFVYLFPLAGSGEDDEPRSLRWLVTAGLLGGFAFSMKPTAVMVLLANVAVLTGVLLHWSAFFASVSGAVLLLVLQGPLDLGKVAERIGGMLSSVGSGAMLLLFAVFTAVFAGIAVVRARLRLKATMLAIITFGAFVIVSIVPWTIHNNLLRGNIIPTGLEFGAPNTLTPILDIRGWSREAEVADVKGTPVRALPPELVVDTSDPACQPTGNIEELDRYWGAGKGIGHYLLLPWRTVMNLHGVGYYVTTIPGLLVFPLLFLLPFFWNRRARWLRWMAAGTLFIVLEWIFLANGIPWYGIGMFLGLCIGLEALLARAPDLLNKTAVSVLVTLWILLMLDMRLWQFELQRNIFEYPMGKINYESLRERTIPHYDDIAEVVLRNRQQVPDRPYLYRVGTFIPYFIPKNLEIIAAADHQLDTFNCLHQERDPALTTKRLKALGFSSIIFDTNTATIEKDLEGSLHKKVEAFVNYLNNPESGVRPVLNDPGAGVAFILIP